MKKIVFLFLIAVSTINLNAQFTTSVGTSFTFYRLTTDEFAYLTPTVDMNLEVGYYFKNGKGIMSGVYAQNRFFDKENQRIITKIVQIPLLFSNTFKFKDVPFGITNSMGYVLTVPYDTKTSQNTSYDIGLIHGLYANYTFDAWIKDHTKFYCGIDASLDLLNENDIKFYKAGIIMGMKVLF